MSGVTFHSLKCNVRLKRECLRVKTKFLQYFEGPVKLARFQAKNYFLHTRKQQLFKETLNIETFCVKVGGFESQKSRYRLRVMLETKRKKP